MSNQSLSQQAQENFTTTKITCSLPDMSDHNSRYPKTDTTADFKSPLPYPTLPYPHATPTSSKAHNVTFHLLLSYASSRPNSWNNLNQHKNYHGTTTSTSAGFQLPSATMLISMPIGLSEVSKHYQDPIQILEKYKQENAQTTTLLMISKKGLSISV